MMTTTLDYVNREKSLENPGPNEPPAASSSYYYENEWNPLSVWTQQEVKDYCIQNIMCNVVKTTSSFIICLDGTSCTNKTTLLNSMSDIQIIKLQNIYNIKNIDTYGPAMLGYTLGGLELLQRYENNTNVMMDRSPLTSIEWRVIWMMMDGYVKKFGNVTVDLDDVNIKQYINDCVRILNALKNCYYYKYLRSRCNILTLTDGDIERCDKMRIKRNATESDSERSHWKFYTFFQNLNYSILYRDVNIDLQTFGKTDRKTVLLGIRDALQELRVNLIIEICKERNRQNFTMIAEATNRKQNLIDYRDSFRGDIMKLPRIDPFADAGVDYTLANAVICTYRGISKYVSKIARYAFDKKENPTPEVIRSVQLTHYIPNFINIFNVSIKFFGQLFKLKDAIYKKVAALSDNTSDNLSESDDNEID